jgi:hypothetical protein
MPRSVRPRQEVRTEGATWRRRRGGCRRNRPGASADGLTAGSSVSAVFQHPARPQRLAWRRCVPFPPRARFPKRTVGRSRRRDCDRAGSARSPHYTAPPARTAKRRHCLPGAAVGAFGREHAPAVRSRAVADCVEEHAEAGRFLRSRVRCSFDDAHMTSRDARVPREIAFAHPTVPLSIHAEGVRQRCPAECRFHRRLRCRHARRTLDPARAFRSRRPDVLAVWSAGVCWHAGIRCPSPAVTRRALMAFIGAKNRPDARGERH